MNANTNGRLLTFLSTALACFVGVSAALWVFDARAVQSRTALETPSDESVAQRELIDAIGELSRHVATLDRENQGLSDPPQRADTRALTDAHATLRSDALLEQIVELLKASGGGSGMVPRGREALDIPRDPRQRSKLTTYTFEDIARLTSDHLLWTPQQVLSTYGRPDSVRSGDLGLYWYYPGTLDKKVRFRFNEGMVSTVDID